MYCVICKKSTESNDVINAISKNGRPMLRGKCAICGSTKTQFIKMNGTIQTGGDLVNSFNSVIPWAKFPGGGAYSWYELCWTGNKFRQKINFNWSLQRLEQTG